MPKPKASRNRKAKSSSEQKYGLISAVRAQKSLYDPKNANFNSKSNNVLWSQIAAQCGIKSGQIARFIWKNIREAYIGYRKNPDKNPNKNYFMFFKHMEFIDPYLMKDSEEDQSSVSSFKENTENEVKEKEVIDVAEPINVNETAANREFTTIQYWNETKDDSENATELDTNLTLQPTNLPCSEIDSDSEMESYEDIMLPSALNNEGNDNSLKMFFDAMFASTSQLPPDFQRTVKRKIFTTILEAEEEAEKQKNCAVGTNCIKIKEDLDK